MKIEWLIQKDGNNTIGDNIVAAFDRSPKKVFAYLTGLKDSGLEILEEGFIGTKADFNVVVAYNKKNTTKIMLESILRNASKVYVYDNNNEVNLGGNIFIFEYKETAVVYYYSGDTTEGTIKVDNSVYVKAIYDLSLTSQKEEYKALRKTLDTLIKDLALEELTRGMLTELQSEKKIFTPKIYNHEVKTVAELLAESKKNKKENSAENVYNEDNMIKPIVQNLDLDSFDISIEVPEEKLEGPKDILDQGEDMDNIEIPEEEYESEMVSDEDLENIAVEDEVVEEDETYEEIDENAIDLESMIFGSNKIKIKGEDYEVDDKKVDEENASIIASKKIDLNSATSLVMQLPRPATKGKELNTIKVPTYIAKMLPSFISFSKNLYKEKDLKYKKIKFSILDVEKNEVFEDNDARLVHKDGQTYLAFTSDVIGNVTIKENYIARIMKISDDEYRCEIIPVDSKEYPVWKKVCTLGFRGSERKYGMM